MVNLLFLFKKYLPQIIGVVVLGIILYVAYNFVYNIGYTKASLETKQCELDHANEVARVTSENSAKLIEISNKYSASSDDLFNSLKDLKVKEKVIKDVVIKEIEKPVYNLCVIPDSGMHTLRETADTLNSTRNKGSK